MAKNNDDKILVAVLVGSSDEFDMIERGVHANKGNCNLVMVNRPEDVFGRIFKGWFEVGSAYMREDYHLITALIKSKIL